MRSLFGLTVVLFACTLSAVAGSNSEGEAFLKENAEKEGVVVLASGLQYKVLTKRVAKFIVETNGEETEFRKLPAKLEDPFRTYNAFQA